jgi:ACS family hexuronate transporter-like MFS transporter
MLLLATTINYMDRQTLSLVKSEIRNDFQAQGRSLTDADYGNLERGFSWAFAVGAVLHGFLADRWSVRWYYPFVLIGWSAAGFATAFADDYSTLLACRTVLGFFESGQWPCALKTSQSILTGRDRTLGNGILQSGAAIGAIATPQVIKLLMGSEATAWRSPFQVIGFLGVLWVFPWLALVRRNDLSAAPAQETDQPKPMPISMPPRTFARRFVVLGVVVIAINLSWHFLRAWLTPFLREVRRYDRDDAFDMTTAYYVAADLGSLSVGLLVRRLVSRGWTIHRARLSTFGLYAALASLAMAVSNVPPGWPLNCLLLLVGFGALGVFPNYYTFSQELTIRHQGLLTGILSFLTWTATGFMQSTVGEHLEQTKSYAEAFYMAGLAPLVAFVALLTFWNWPERKTK